MKRTTIIIIMYYKVLKKISETHQPFYVRSNNNKGAIVNFGNNRIYALLEVSYLIKKDNSFIKDENTYPMYEFEFSKPTIGKAEMNLNTIVYLKLYCFLNNILIAHN